MMRADKKRAQTLLETALVFISLAALVVGAIGIFVHFNENSFSRLNLYKQSRLNAVNSLAQVGKGMDPKEYLKFGPQPKFNMPILPPGVLSSDLLQEDRVLQAELYLEDMDNVLNFILPYKMNQIKEISPKLELVLVRNKWGWRLSKYEWMPSKYVKEIQTLCNEMISDASTAYNEIYASGGAVALFNDVLASPTAYSPYAKTTCSLDKPLECNDPRLPKYEDQEGCSECMAKYVEQYTSAYNMLQSNVEQSRAMLSQTVSGLTQAKTGLHYLLYEVPFPRENLSGYLQPNLEGILNRLVFIRDNIGVGGRSAYRWLFIILHNDAVTVMNEMLDFLGVVSPCRLTNSFADEISTVYSLLLRAPLQSAVQNALNTARQWVITYRGVTYINSITQEIASDLDVAIENWTDQKNRSYYVSSARLNALALYKVTAINRRGNYP